MGASRSMLASRSAKCGTGWIVAWAIAGCLSCIGACVANDDELDDAAARMQYAFYTVDIRALENVLAALERVDLSPPLEPMKQYYAAYGHWKLAQLYVELDGAGRRDARSLAGRAAATCSENAKAAQRAGKHAAELQAIEAVCSSFNSTSRAAGPAAGNCFTSKTLRKALALEPGNPRVRLVEATCVATDKKAAALLFDKARAAVASFDAAPPAAPGVPDWGQAEALMLLAQSAAQRGDTRVARDMLERALVIAPDYTRARALLDAGGARKQ